MSQNPENTTSGDTPWTDPQAPRNAQSPQSAQPHQNDQNYQTDRTADAEPARQAPAQDGDRHQDRRPELDPKLDGRSKSGVSGATWFALIIGLIILILLLVFVLQNMKDIQIAYMSWEFALPLGVAMLLAAIAGALITALVGSIRLAVLSRRVHKLEKERETIRRTLR